MIGVAVAATFDTSETCTECRIAITGISAIATRAPRAEDQLIGSRLTAAVIEAAANLATDGIAVTGDAFGSAAYLAELIPIYVYRTLAQLAAPDPEGDGDNGHRPSPPASRATSRD